MKKYIRKQCWLFLLAVTLLFTGCTTDKEVDKDNSQTPAACEKHIDDDNNNLCDKCGLSVLVYVDFYSVNDLHGKVVDNESQPGVDELTTYIKNARVRDDYVILLSAGDMWQGSAESNLTKGNLTTEWMNELDFVSMTMGNHEYDWGEEYIEANALLAEFPFLAINIYDKETNQLVDYCEPSVVVEAGDLQIGIIGAIGDCYSSIAADKVGDVYFKVDNELTELVKAESERLRGEGVDCIVYVLHDGYGESKSNDAIPSSKIASYYDIELSDGYVDLVFEAHTHQTYILQDEYGVYHMQHGGDNNGGISHVEIAINSVNSNVRVNMARLVETSSYESLNADPIIEELLKKYENQLAVAYDVLGSNSYERKSNYLKQLVANMYYQAGIEKWGEEYDIALGGGFISVRSPYSLNAGNVTYAQLQTLLPFDNELVLCSIKGSDLLSKFFNTNNSNYYISYGDYGANLKNNIDPNGTYYIVTDTYSSLYKPNRLTEVARYDSGIYARDLVAEFIKNGGLE
ncbi:MAG: 5'-nucleotidase C-terminal domain-containing protein [Agathobacter sp.]|nr:5'-nucleotidase C-terminal domain-containing protein [Agathobacter sp.]